MPFIFHHIFQRSMNNFCFSKCHFKMQYVRFIFMFSGRKMHFENKLSQSIEINGGRGGERGKCYEKLLQFCFLYFILKGHEPL